MLLHDGTGFSVNGSLYPNLSFDYRKDFEPVFLVSLVPNILVVTPSVPVTTMADVIAYAKAQPNGSTWRRPATARCSICASKCSATSPASRSTTCPIAAAALRSPT
jgi:tripartite-type tricarboxylate transporter receptor subunit TctC